LHNRPFPALWLIIYRRFDLPNSLMSMLENLKAQIFLQQYLHRKAGFLLPCRYNIRQKYIPFFNKLYLSYAGQTYQLVSLIFPQAKEAVHPALNLPAVKMLSQSL
jgi:hypothetical protein